MRLVFTGSGRRFIRFAAGAVVVFSLSGCDLSLLEQKDDGTRKPATEATVIGIWRTNIPTGMAPPDPVDYKVTLDIEPDHTMLFSKRLATGKAPPYDYVELVKEYWTWSVADGAIAGTKTGCVYKDAGTLAETSRVCKEPTTWAAAIDVTGTAWTATAEGVPVVFRKD